MGESANIQTQLNQVNKKLISEASFNAHLKALNILHIFQITEKR